MRPEGIDCTITSWESALKIFGLLHEKWIFRGHSSEEWGLQPSLERYAKVSDGQEHREIMRLAEEDMLTAIRGQAHFRLGVQNRDMSSVDWLALLQHHGAVTRLLDFTRSVYVALFFAVEGALANPESLYSAVWAFDVRAIWDQVFFLLDEPMNPRDFARRMAIVINENIDGTSSDRGVGVFEPSISSERIAIQQGIFLMSLRHQDSLEAALQAIYPRSGPPWTHFLQTDSDQLYQLLLETKDDEPNPQSIKFLIPDELKFRILAELRAMNITANTLFPGLDGFSRSLNFLATGYQRIDQDDTLE